MGKNVFVLVVVFLIIAALLPVGALAEEPYEISLLVGDLANPYWQSLIGGAELAAESLDVDLTVLGLDYEGNMQMQISQVEDRVSAEADAIIMAPQDAKGLVPAIEELNEAGIPVITVSKSCEGGEIVSKIQTDNIAAGEMEARWLVDQIGGKGLVLLLEGVPGQESAELRKRGAMNVFEEYPDIEVITLAAHWETGKAQAATEDTLTAHDDLAGICAMNDMMAIGAETALAAMGLVDEVPVVGCDAVDAALEMIQDGRLGATVAQFPGREGFMGVEYAVRVLDGEDVPENMATGIMLVTGDNVLAKKAGLYGW